MSTVPKRRWFRFSLRTMFLAVTLVWLLMFSVVQRLKNAKLEADKSRLESSNAALLNERVDLKWRVEAWKQEAVEWRIKNGIDPEYMIPPPGEPPD